MAKAQVFAGIDIGSSKVATIVASFREGEPLNITGVSSVVSRGLRRSQIIDIEKAVGAVVESVEAAERMAGFALSSAFISIGGQGIDSLNSKGVVAVAQPQVEITNEDVERVLESAEAISLPSSQQILHVIPAEFIVDSQGGIKDPVGMTGVRLEAETHIITATATAVRNLKKCVNEVGIDVERLVFTGLAASEAVLTETEKELGVCLVDLGGGTTSVCVFQEGSLVHSSVVPIGAKKVTDDLAIGLRVSLESAEKIKEFLGRKIRKPTLPEADKEGEREEDEIDLSPLRLPEKLKTVSRKTLTEGIIRPRLDEIFNLVAKRLKTEHLVGTTPAGIVLTGGGAETAGVVESCKKVLAMPVRVGRPHDLGGLKEEVTTPAFAASVGLVLYGLSQRRRGRGLSFPGLELIKEIPARGMAHRIAELVRSFLP